MALSPALGGKQAYLFLSQISPFPTVPKGAPKVHESNEGLPDTPLGGIGSLTQNRTGGDTESSNPLPDLVFCQSSGAGKAKLTNQEKKSGQQSKQGGSDQ